MDFTVTVTDQRELDGLAAAAAMYNQQLAGSEDFVPLSLQDYVSFVMSNAVKSYANQYFPVVSAPAAELMVAVKELQDAAVAESVTATPVALPPAKA